MTNKTTLYILLTMVALLSSLSLLTSCNKDKDSDDTFTYSTSTQTTLVTSFGLQADGTVLASLDSVHFTVDYDNGLIYNADSLPVGTKISALKVNVKFLNTVKSAEFHISSAAVQSDTVINYSTSSSQSIDFTGFTVLKVTSADGQQVKEYEVKVLVHEQNPDTLVWPQSWRRDLPGYNSGMIAHKTVKLGDSYRSLAYDGTRCLLMTASTLSQRVWDQREVALPFTPDVNTLVATDEALYMLAVDGQLYTSTDGADWTSCGVKWHSLLATYGSRVLGIMNDGEGYCHDEYPRSAGYTCMPVEDGFPIHQASSMIESSYKWTVSQQTVIMGGVDSEGKTLNAVWGYDGETWGKINTTHGTALPALKDATLFSYYTFRPLVGVRRYARQATWYLMGGRKDDGSLNGDIYLSSSQGVTWVKADSTISQASYMPKFYGAQALVEEEMLTVNRAPSRVSTAITSWICPYIYLMGGYNELDVLLPNMWQGVYVRMTNSPIY